MTEPVDRESLVELDEIAEFLMAREGPRRPQLLRRQPAARRRAALALAAVVALAAVGGAVAVFLGAGADSKVAGSTGTAARSCAATVEWNGDIYLGTRLPRPATFAGSLGMGTTPACSDGSGGTTAQPVALVALKDVSSDEAIAVAEDASTIYVKPGYFPQMPNTALHNLLYGPGESVPDERGTDCQQADAEEINASVQSADFGILHVHLLNQALLPRNEVLFPDARTQITGGGATPRVSPGDVIHATVLVCRKTSEPHFLKLVASRIVLSN
jgi:hypothetical protein